MAGYVGGGAGGGEAFWHLKSEKPATQTDFLGNQDNLTTINTLSEGKITFCSNTDHVQMTGFSFKSQHRKTVYISQLLTQAGRTILEACIEVDEELWGYFSAKDVA